MKTDKSNKIHWNRFNNIRVIDNISLCRGEIDTLSEEEINKFNYFIDVAESAALGLKGIAILAKDRFDNTKDVGDTVVWKTNNSLNGSRAIIMSIDKLNNKAVIRYDYNGVSQLDEVNLSDLSKL